MPPSDLRTILLGCVAVATADAEEAFRKDDLDEGLWLQALADRIYADAGGTTKAWQKMYRWLEGQ